MVRVVKGNLADEELAALTAVLLARAAAAPKAAKGAGAGMTQAQWQRPERRPSYNSPVSWHR
ncbi:acyl-CoA carboxylase epsilon subunit [Streptacidiphilus carbonis]|uniref:acyl-CoA carboxylase epsilon subunit n=1 Tax=Streptacidiphilus carbonis TaxID=105422 RepID=UPI0005A64EE1|nr:acyl-CoA carboxylase epsilon subunit [Streptacidiphilus carbonis]